MNAFNITHVHRELTDLYDGLDAYALILSRQTLLDRLDCIFQSLYMPHLPNNDEKWKVFKDYESICVFIENQRIDDSKIMSLKDNKYLPKFLYWKISFIKE